jgi:hypothetical protein
MYKYLNVFMMGDVALTKCRIEPCKKKFKIVDIVVTCGTLELRIP